MRAGSGSVYLWLEKSCPPKRRDLALEIAGQYLRARNARYGRHSAYTLKALYLYSSGTIPILFRHYTYTLKALCLYS
jgi:hypothetical protein